MKAALFICLILTFFGACGRHLIESAGAKTAARTFASLCSLLCLIVLAGAAHGGIREIPTMEFQNDTASLQSLSAETMEAVCAEAERLLAERLSAGIAAACRHTPAACRAVIDRETLHVTAVTVRFSEKDLLLSSYEVKKYVRAQCGADTAVEVVFE